MIKAIIIFFLLITIIRGNSELINECFIPVQTKDAIKINDYFDFSKIHTSNLGNRYRAYRNPDSFRENAYCFLIGIKSSKKSKILKTEDCIFKIDDCEDFFLDEDFFHLFQKYQKTHIFKPFYLVSFPNELHNKIKKIHLIRNKKKIIIDIK